MPTRYGRTRSLRVVVARVGVVATRRPTSSPPARRSRIREQPQADDAGRVAVVRSRRVDRLAARADRDARILLLVLERIGRAVGRALVEPEPVALGSGPVGLVEARLVDQPEVLPAVVAAESSALGCDETVFRKSSAPNAVDAERVPEAVVAAGPDDPRVAALDLLGRQRRRRRPCRGSSPRRRPGNDAASRPARRLVEDLARTRRDPSASTEDQQERGEWQGGPEARAHGGRP